MRIGQGVDVHAFDEGKFIVLGGVKIDHTQGLKAHSDGDVLLHALMDALLGSLALGDIGHHFPDTSPSYRGANSRVLLQHVYQLILRNNHKLHNADLTIIAQAPKMAPHIDAMRANIAEDLATEISNISVKATTTEQLGFTGRGEGICCLAAVLLEPY